MLYYLPQVNTEKSGDDDRRNPPTCRSCLRSDIDLPAAKLRVGAGVVEARAIHSYR